MQVAEAIITEEDFQKFREYFYRKTGIQFDASKRYFVDKRLVDRIEPPIQGVFATTSRCCASRLRGRNCSY